MAYHTPTQSQIDPETLCVHAGQGTRDGSPLLTPIVQSTTFVRDGLESTAPHAYSRVSNPTVDALEQTLGALEGAPPAVCFSTGLAAETALFLALLRAGDHAVCGRAVYGGTTRLLDRVLAPLGVECSFVDATDPDAVARAIRPTTRLIFVETPANPTLELTDIAALAAIARDAGALLAVDNTFLTPILQRPLDLGAHITVTSTTKFIDGHSAALGGSVVSRDTRFLERLRFLRKCTGAITTPFNAWLTLQGLKTLPIRLERQCATADRLARWLAQRPEVRRVHYPGLEDFPQRALALAQHDAGSWTGHGAVVTVEFAGDAARTRSILASLTHTRLVEHVGSVETLATHPATMTHADLTPAQRAAAGISDGLVRFSVGLEPFDTIADDLDAALNRALHRARSREAVLA